VGCSAREAAVLIKRIEIEMLLKKFNCHHEPLSQIDSNCDKKQLSNNAEVVIIFND